MLILTCIVVAVLMHVAAPSNRKCNLIDGICQNKNILCDGNYTEGLCCGGADIQCCFTGDFGGNGTKTCTKAQCHTRCRSGNTDSGEMFLTGYCRFSILAFRYICACSNECNRVANRAAACKSLCKDKGFKNSVCSRHDNLCHCGP